MNTTTTPVRRFSAVAPLLILLLLAGLSIEEGLRLILTVDAAAQAGPAGWYVLLLGLILAGTTIYTERPSVAPPPPADDDDTERPATPTRDMVMCLGVLALYAVLLGTAGYVLAGVVAVFVFLRAISRYGWPRSVLYTLAINAVFVALFELSGVVLPTGLLEF